MAGGVAAAGGLVVAAVPKQLVTAVLPELSEQRLAFAEIVTGLFKGLVIKIFTGSLVGLTSTTICTPTFPPAALWSVNDENWQTICVFVGFRMQPVARTEPVGLA